MLFGFYENFTPDDFITKVRVVGQSLEGGEGASIQFNGDNSLRDAGSEVELLHAGVVTVVHPVSRLNLITAILEATPTGARELGPLEPKKGWPRTIGTTDRLDALLDDLFVYSYCIEQGKRRLRGRVLLPALPAGTGHADRETMADT